MRLQHVQQLRVVNLQQHAGDLASQLRVHALDQWEQPLTQHLLLLLWWGCSQHTGSQGVLSWDHHRLLGLQKEKVKRPIAFVLFKASNESFCNTYLFNVEQ